MHEGSLPPLSMLRTFEAAARLSSFKLAAAELRVTPTAVSHQVRKLEEHLGVALFDRETRGVVPTGHGLVLSAGMARALTDIREALDRVTRPPVRSVVIGATPAFATKWLLPRMASLREALASTELKVVSSLVPAVIGRDVDIAIRYTYDDNPQYESICLADDVFSPMANPLVIGANGQLPDDLPRISFNWLLDAHRRVDWPAWDRAEAAGGESSGIAREEMRYSEESDAILAAIAGQGVILASHLLTQDDRQEGRLSIVGDRRPLAGPRFLALKQKSEEREAVLATFAWLRRQACNGTVLDRDDDGAGV